MVEKSVSIAEYLRYLIEVGTNVMGLFDRTILIEFGL